MQTCKCRAAGASADRGSEHPLGKAVVRYAYEHGVVTEEPVGFRYEIGRGISAFVGGEHVIAGNRTFLESLGVAVPNDQNANGTKVHVASGGQYAGSISIDDKIRAGSAAAVRALENMKIRVVLLTGDTSVAAEAVANELGILHFHSPKFSVLVGMCGQKDVLRTREARKLFNQVRCL